MTNTTGNHWYTRIIYIIPVTLNAGIYLLIAFIYEVLASVARAEIVASSSVAGVFTRIQLIIGVFMLFRLAISVLQGIVDPDKAMDSKTGMGSLIVKIIVCLTMLTLLVPISYPKAYNSMNKFEKQVSTKGILFGVLYDFQDRIINGNVLAKLILNTTNDSNNNATGAELSAVVLKTFLTPNLKEGAATKFELKIGKSGEPEYPKKYWFCDAFETDGIYDKYYKTSDPDTLLAMTFEGCQKKGESDIGDNNYFAFNFNWFISLIVGILFLVVLVLITIEVAKRAIKLAILRLIAPIPILSYMAPKSDFQNGPMGAWIKTLFSTYLDLFIQLSTVYFAIFIIAEIRRQGGLEFDQQVSGIVWLFAHVFVYIGLLLFAKEAPKFLKQALGLKEEGGALGALGGTLAGAIGAVGSYKTAKDASRKADEEAGRDHNFINRMKNRGAGLLGGMGGFMAGANAKGEKGGNSFKAGIDAVNANNARRRNGGSWLTRTGDMLGELTTGGVAKQDREIEELENQLKQPERRNKAAANLASVVGKHKDLVAQKALEQKNIKGTTTLSDGRVINANVAALKQAMQGKQAGDVVYRTENGKDVYAGEIDANVISDLTDSQAVAFESTDAYRSDGKVQGSLAEVAYAVEQVDGIDYNGSYDDAGMTIGAAKSAALDSQKEIDNIQEQIIEIKEDPTYQRKKYNSGRK